MEYIFSKKNEQVRIKELFDEYYGRLVHFSYQFVADKATAEDVVQDAFIKYWNQHQSISQEKNSIKSFLYATVKNASLNVIRHNKVAEEHIKLQDKDPVEECVINAMIRSEVVAEIYKAISSLPDACQKISRLGYLDGKKNHEIAEELGISVNTVKTQKKRALKILRLKLIPDLFAVLVLLFRTI